jgi:hypothetical protein
MDNNICSNSRLCSVQHPQQNVNISYTNGWLDTNLCTSLYDIAMFTYLIAFSHFVSEWLIFRTTKFGAGLLGPLVVSSKSGSQGQCRSCFIKDTFSLHLNLDVQSVRVLCQELSTLRTRHIYPCNATDPDPCIREIQYVEFCSSAGAVGHL